MEAAFSAIEVVGGFVDRDLMLVRAWHGCAGSMWVFTLRFDGKASAVADSSVNRPDVRGASNTALARNMADRSLRCEENGSVMSRSQRDKGARAEREIVDRHKAINVHAERYPLSGASRFRGSGHDIDL